MGEKEDGEMILETVSIDVGPRKEFLSASLDDVARRAEAIGFSFANENATFQSPVTEKVHSLDLAVIPEVVFYNVEMFYVCSNCAKVYWDGSHYKRTNDLFAGVLGFDIDDATRELKINS